MENHKPLLCGAALVAAVLLIGCSDSSSMADADTSLETHDELPERFFTEEHVPIPSFLDEAKAPEFQKAIQETSRLLGAQPKPLSSRYEGVIIEGGVSFDVPMKKVEATLRSAHTTLLARGFYLFRYEQNYGLGGAPDRVALLPTTDKYAVMAAMETNGINYGIGTAGVVAWMKELEEEHAYILTGIGGDYLEGYFTPPINEPGALAKRMYEFCPDIVDQGVGTIGRLEAELRKGALYFWWD